MRQRMTRNLSTEIIGKLVDEARNNMKTRQVFCFEIENTWQAKTK